MTVAFWVEVFVAVLLVVTVAYCFILNRRLSELRGAQGELQKIMTEFADATRVAETGLSDLRHAGAQIAGDLKAQVDDARALYDELKIMTESGNELADRIEKGLVGRNEPTAPSVSDDDITARSESERELIEALRQPR